MDKKSKLKKYSRRAFMVTGIATGGGLIVGLGGMSYINKRIKIYPELGLGEGVSLNAWVRIRPNNRIAICVPRAEMGQGVNTSLPMLIAEELEINLSDVDVVHPQLAAPYTNLSFAGERDAFKENLSFIEKVFHLVEQVGTGGSTSIRDAYDQYRLIGATTREMLIAAASKKWNIEPDQCYASEGFVLNTQNDNKIPYSELADLAVAETPSSHPKLKPRSEFKLIGKPTPRLDLEDKVNGKAVFGMDVRVPDMLFGAVKHPPITGGKITGILNQDRVEKMQGVKKVILLDDSAVVVADNSWRAMNAARILDLEIDDHGYGNLSSVEIFQSLSEKARQEPKYIREKKGDVQLHLQDSDLKKEAEYQVPYLAHACMEPLNTTVLVQENQVEVWSGNQMPMFVANAVKDGTGISKKNIRMHIPYLGGGFGRRAEKDFVLQAARVAKVMEGTPVQLIWSRDEDMRNDMYRPAAVSNFKAALSQKGDIKAWANTVVCQSAVIGLMERNVGFMVPKKKDDTSSTEGAAALAYNFETSQIGFDIADFPVRVGTWRSVGHSQNAFFTESFMDELAHLAQTDPYRFRKDHLEGHPRMIAILDKVAELSAWQTTPMEGHYRGIAIHESFGSFVAQVVEIKMNGEKDISLEKVFCVIDCGQTVNPDTIEAQMQSCIVFALSATIYGEITIKDGEVEQYNFPQYEMLRLKQMPKIITHIMENEEKVGGVGEPGVPPLAPALCNAIFAATGERIRSLPLQKHGINVL